MTQTASQNANPQMNLPLFSPIAAGLATAQAIATVYVYLSNTRLLYVVTATEKAGWFAIPTGPVTTTLNQTGSAFWGGLFFTLSIGVGLTLATWAGLVLREVLFQRKRPISYAYAAIYLGLAAWVNSRGPVLFPTLFCLLVPLATVLATLKTLPHAPAPRNFLWAIPLLVFVALTALWGTQYNQNLFAAIRDHLLLSNPVGRTVNNFYYRYTLYAAEAFKSFDQKTLRGCRLQGITDANITRRWEKRLARYDVMALPDIDDPDVKMIFSDNRLQMVSRQGDTVDTTAELFLASPEKQLKAFSNAADRFGPFRRLTLAGLLIGFPTLLFVTVYGILRNAMGWIARPKTAIWTAAALCLVIGAMLFAPMRDIRPIPLAPDRIEKTLSHTHWPQRVAALRYIEKQRLEITDYPAYRKLLDSPLVVERYWLARAMAGSRSDTTYHQLLKLMHDPHPNVICQAFYALGAHGNKAAIAPIGRRMRSIDNWYAQWYGYRALRKLGWRQKQSN